MGIGHRASGIREVRGSAVGVGDRGSGIGDLGSGIRNRRAPTDRPTDRPSWLACFQHVCVCLFCCLWGGCVRRESVFFFSLRSGVLFLFRSLLSPDSAYFFFFGNPTCRACPKKYPGSTDILRFQCLNIPGDLRVGFARGGLVWQG